MQMRCFLAPLLSILHSAFDTSMNFNDALDLDIDPASTNVPTPSINDNSFTIGEIMQQNSTNGVFDVVEGASNSLNQSNLMSHAAENSSRHLAGALIVNKTPAYGKISQFTWILRPVISLFSDFHSHEYFD
jgi:hypothetical protein